MRHYNLKFEAIAICASTFFLLSSCRHKDIEFEDIPMQEVNVVFDWRNAPDANPSSMATYFFDTDSHEDIQPLRFDFQNMTGGEIKIPYGTYSGIALNSDATDWAALRNTNDVDGFEIYTHESTYLPSSGLRIRSIPRAKEAEDETVVETPGLIWGSRSDNLSLASEDRQKTFTFYPEELICHYKVDILDIENISSIEATGIDATLSGMAGGYLHGQGKPTDTKCTLPFLLVKDEQKKALHGEFLTFGESPLTKNPHKLAVYTILSDGNKYLYTFDVSDQVYNAPDPRHVNIIVRGLSLPQPVEEGNGFIPDVEEWESVDIDIKM